MLFTRAQLLVLMEYVLNDPTSCLREMEQYLIDSTGSSLIKIFLKVPLLLGSFITRTNILRGVVCKPANKTTSEPTKIYDSFKSFKPLNADPCTRASCSKAESEKNTPYSKMAAILVFFCFHANWPFWHRSKLNIL